MLDIRFLAGKEVIQADDVVAFRDQPLAQMRAEKSCSTRYEGTPFKMQFN